MRSSFRGLQAGAIATLLAVLFSMMVGGQSTAFAATDAVINEFSVSTTGSDVEYIEIFGSPSTDYSNLTLLQIEGSDSSAISGEIDAVVSFSMTDANGFEVVNVAANTFENDSYTLLLVDGFTGAQGDDLDTNDDSTFNITPWTAIIDSVSVDDGSSRNYSSVVLDEFFDDAVVTSTFSPGGASRIPDGTDTDTTDDWVRNDFNLAPLEQGSPVPGEALNTPGTSNEVVPPAPPIVNNCFYNEGFEALPGDTYTLSNIFDDGSFDYFGRYSAPSDGGGRDDFQTGFYGNFAIYGQDHDGEDVATQSISIDGVDISALSDVTITLAAGALNGEPDFFNYEAGDGIEIYANVDGGGYTYVGGFLIDGADGDLLADTDANGTGDGAILSVDLADFTFDIDAITGTGNNLDLRIDMTSDDSFEPLVVDHVRIGCDTLDAKIHDVQGTGDTAAEGPWAIEGIVVGTYQADDQLQGFFLQEEDADIDADPTTSEGIFVFCGLCSTPVAEGDLVAVEGSVAESGGMARMSAATYSVTSTGNDLPTPGLIELPVAGDIDTYYEQFEGMLVNFTDTLYVSEYFQLARYGQIVLYEGGRPYQFTQTNTPDAAGLTAHLDELDTRRVILDDDDNIQNSPLPDGVYYYPQPDGFAAGSHGTDFFRGNDQVESLIGVLDFSGAGNSGTEAWRVRPTSTNPVEFTPTNPRPETPDDVGGNVTVGVLNVLNYFVTIDDGTTDGDDCGPTGNDECRGADSTQELDRQAEKIIAALADMDADVIGLVELENNADDAAVADLVSRLNTATGETYDYVAIGFVGSDVITNGIIYNTATVQQTGTTAVLESGDFLDPNSIGDDKNRPAVTASFEVIAGPDTGEVFTVSVNHLKSKGSPCGAGDDDTVSGQGNCNDTRAKAAQALADWLATDPTDVGDDDVLIIGDLNSYAMEEPIDVLKTEGYADLLQEFEGSDVYTYLFDGQVGTLDYIMSNSSITPFVSGATAWNINADEVPVLDYNDDIEDAGEAFFEEEADGNNLYAPNEFRSSDHDAVLVGLDFTVNAPAGINATYNSESHLGILTWNNDLSVDQYRIERQKLGAESWLELAVVPSTNDVYSDDIVTCDQNYVYRLTAITNGVEGTAAISNFIDTECNIFDDIPGPNQPPAFEAWVEDFYQEGLTTGCDAGIPGMDLSYCPEEAVDRGQMAVFILRALGVEPTDDPSDPFTDVPDANQPPSFEAWIETFLAEGLTTGCNAEGTLFCPTTTVDRGQMAVFILRALDVEPTDDPNDPFSDVPSPNQPPTFEAWIETFYTLGITVGCQQSPDLLYCPETTVDRGQMAVFILRAFDDLPDPEDP